MQITDTLQLLPTDKELTIRIFIDRTIVEVYFMDGRVAMTLGAPATATTGSVSVGATGTSTVASAAVWTMGGIWTTSEEILAAHRAAA